MTNPTLTAPTPAAEQPKFLDRPIVKEAIRIGVAVLLAWLAANGIRVSDKPTPPVVVVNATAPAGHQ